MKIKLALFALSDGRHHACKALIELAGAAFFVVFALFARVGRVRCGRRIDIKYGITVAVRPFARLIGGRARTNQPAGVGAAVVKQNHAVVVGVDTCFHRFLLSENVMV